MPPCTPIVVDVREQRQAAGPQTRRAVGLLHLHPGDKVEHQLRHNGVRAHHDVHRRRLTQGLERRLPPPIRRFVAAVQAHECTLERVGNGPIQRRVDGLAPPLRELGSDVVPQVQISDLMPRGVIVDGDARHLHDARLDGVHEREIAYHPRKDITLVVARPFQIKGRGAEVIDRLYTHLLAHRLQALEPHPSALVTFLGLLLRLGVELFVDLLERTVAITVMRLVVEDDDLPTTPSTEVTQHAGHDLIGGLGERVDLLVALQDQASGPGHTLDLLRVAGQERVVVRDDQFGVAHRAPQVGGHEITLTEVVALITRIQDPEPVPDRDAGRDDQEPFREPGVLRAEHLVDGLPRNQHGHDHGLARPRCHLQTDSRKSIVVESVLVGHDRAIVGPLATGDLSQEDRRLSRFPLTEQHPVVARRIGPVLEQLAGVRGHSRVAAGPPQLNLAPDVIDQRVHRPALARSVEVEGSLGGLAHPALLRRGDRDERLARSPPFDDLARDAAGFGDLEMALRRVVRAVQDRVIDS